MAAETFFAEVMALLFSAMFSYIACYMIYKRFSVAVWGYIAAFLPRIPVGIVAATGGTNLALFAWLSHTVGVLVYALLLAIKREVGAITLYDNLSSRAEDDDLRSTFEALAEEERRHKLRLETIYDDTFMRED